MQWVWTWGGIAFGYMNDNYLWAYDGRHVGRIQGNEIYGKNGEYLGEIKNEDRLITNISKKSYRSSGFAPCDCGGYARYADYVGYAMYAGYEDFPKPEEL